MYIVCSYIMAVLVFLFREYLLERSKAHQADAVTAALVVFFGQAYYQSAKTLLGAEGVLWFGACCIFSALLDGTYYRWRRGRADGDI